MLIVSLDESGYFGDGSNDGSKVFFVGGVVFHAADNDAYISELNRLQKWFMNCCSNCKARYPEDLHRDKTKGSDNASKTLEVKKELSKTISDFVNGSEKWGQPNGTYDFYAMVGSLNCSPKLFSGESNLIEDGTASNRYQHIAFLTLDRLLFRTHQLFDDKQVKLQIATRSFFNMRDKSAVKELKENGHYQYSKNDGVVTQITDTNCYRGMLISSLPGSNRKDSHFDMDVRPINYKSDNSNLEQGFFYLADTICSIFGDVIKNSKTANTYIGMEKIGNYCKDNFSNSNSYVWSYDEVDALWVESLKALEAGDYYRSLECIFDSQKENEKIYNYYKDNWHKYISENINSSNDYSKLLFAIEKLKKYYAETYENDKGGFILSNLEEAILKNESKAGFKELIYDLYALKMTVANHNGDYKESKKYYDLAYKYSDYTSIENFCEIRNMYSVFLCDSLHFEEARKHAADTIRFLKEYIEWRKEYTVVGNPVILGRSYSQEGQAYAFLENYDKAIESFEEALRIFKQGSSDYQRTMSYYLHALIESGDVDKYKEKAAEYFGTSDLKEQYLHSSDIPHTHQEFALYVYVKAFYVLKLMHEFDKADINEFLKWMDVKFEKDSLGKNHPKELLLKYCAFICKENGNPIKASSYLDMTGDLERETLIGDIINNGYEEYERIKNKQNPFENDHFTYMYR